MELTLRFKITMTEGTVIQVEEELKTVRAMMESVPRDGYRHTALCNRLRALHG